MLTEKQQEQAAATVRTLQIIHGALIMGVVTFAGVTLFVRADKAETEETPILAYVGVAAAVICAIAAFMLPRITNAASLKALADAADSATPQTGGRGSGNVEPLLGIYQTNRIIAVALLEGPAFLNAVVYLLNGTPASLGIVAALVAGMIMMIPTQGRLTAWLEQKLRDLSDARQLASPQ